MHLQMSLTRTQVLSRAVKGGAALAVMGSVAGPLLGSAAAATPDVDLAYVRLLIGAELLAADFYTLAVAAKKLDGDPLKYVRRALFNEIEHYHALAGIMTGAGQAPAVPGDFDFTYPNGAFASKASIAKLGVMLETISLGAYLGAVDGLQTNSLKQPVARIAASEAEHLSVLRRMAGSKPIGISFPDALSIDDASNALDAFTS
jgi:hypothetical protein